MGVDKMGIDLKGIDVVMIPLLKRIRDRVVVQHWSHCRLRNEGHTASWEHSCKAAWHDGVVVVDYMKRIEGSGWLGSIYHLAAAVSMVHSWKLVANTDLVSRS